MLIQPHTTESRTLMATIIAQATLLLRQLSPADIASDEAAELREVGLALFGRLAIKQAYGEKDVIEFLREQADSFEPLY